MGMYDVEVRRLRETELRCPNCDAENTQGQPTRVHLDPGNQAHCDACQHKWIDKER